MSRRRYGAVRRCCSELTWLLEDGQTSKLRQAASLIQHLHRPLQFPQFQCPAGKSSCLPALIPAPHREKAALPPLPAQEEEEEKEGRKRREGENTSGINWRALNASERTAELAETIARSRAFRRDYRAKVEDETYTAYLNTKPELLLGLVFLMQAAKRLSPVTFSLPLVHHESGQNSVQKIGDEMHTAPAEANGTHLWLKCQDSVTQQQYYIKLLSGCEAEEICDCLGTLSRTEIWRFKNADFFPQLLSIPAMHSRISSFVPRGDFHFQGSLHCVSWKAEILERSRGSWRSNSLVQQPGNKDWLQLFGYSTNK